jgi:hypothetical protein
MNEATTDSADTDLDVASALTGKMVVTADGETIGPVEGETKTYLRVRADASDAPGGQLWLPKRLVDRVDQETVRLNRDRADLHDAVLSMPPGEQREFGSLMLNVRIGRTRGLGRAV